MKDYVVTLIDFLNALNNDNRRKILRLCFDKPKSIAELVRLLNSSDKVTRENIQKLKDWKLVTLEKKEHEKHRPVYVKSNVLPEWYESLFKAAFIDLRNSLETINKKTLKVSAIPHQVNYHNHPKFKYFAMPEHTGCVCYPSSR